MKDDNNIKQNASLQKVKSVLLSELTPENKKGNSFLNGNYSVISGLKLNLEAIIGTAELTVKELFDLQSGSIVELDQSIETLITLRLDGKAIAYGSLVVVGDNFGIRIVEIIDTTTKAA